MYSSEGVRVAITRMSVCPGPGRTHLFEWGREEVQEGLWITYLKGNLLIFPS